MLSAREIGKVHGLRTLFRGVSLSLAAGDRLGLVGPNGAGKSTLLKLLARLEAPDDGQITTERSLRVVYVAQSDLFDEDAPARESVVKAAERGAIGRGEHPEPHESELVAARVLNRLGFSTALADTAAGRLSGGWRKRLSIAAGLASAGDEPDLLLLDEPTNHLDLEGIAWLEELVQRLSARGSNAAVVFVTHDRAFLESCCSRVAELSAAYPAGLFAADGNYTEFLRRKQEFLDAQAKTERALAGQVRQDLAWLARGPKARRTKSKSRIESSHERIGDLAKMRVRSAAADRAGAGVSFVGTQRKSRLLLEATDLSKSLSGRKLFSGLSFKLGAGDRLGLLGPNGGGKTTLIRVLTGELEPDAGSIRRGDPQPKIAVLTQHRREIAPDLRLREALWPIGDRVEFAGGTMHVSAWAKRFLFHEGQLEQPVASLSGGELARVHIAKIMLSACDILILDEPTNDLDIPTIESLESSIEEFPGAVILVTHDRAMLDRLCSSIVALDGLGGARVYASLEQALRGVVPASSSGRAPEPAQIAPKRAKKLSYLEQREYDGIEARIAQAEASVTSARAMLEHPSILGDHTRMTEACTVLAEAERLVESLYARWHELEQKRT